MPDGFIPSLSALVDSGKRTIKQKLADLLSNPLPYLQQTAGQVNEDAKSFNRTSLAAALGDPMAKSKLQSSMLYTAMNFAPAMTVWHGSPHKFSKFDMSKIGTGEGAQAYGHGLYMAENPAVAKEYANALSVPEIVAGAERYSPKQDPYTDPRRVAYNALTLAFENQSSNPYGAAMRTLENQYLSPAAHAQAVKHLAEWDSKGARMESGGSVYKSDIPDEAVARFLDWDKPLSQQAPEAQAALSAMKQKLPKGEDGWDIGPFMDADPLFSTFHNSALRDLNVKPESFTSEFKQAGIPGIRYFDGGSRAAGQGSSNFVLFDDQLPRILEINGAPTGLQPWKPGEWK